MLVVWQLVLVARQLAPVVRQLVQVVGQLILVVGQLVPGGVGQVVMVVGQSAQVVGQLVQVVGQLAPVVVQVVVGQVVQVVGQLSWVVGQSAQVVGQLVQSWSRFMLCAGLPGLPSSCCPLPGPPLMPHCLLSRCKHCLTTTTGRLALSAAERTTGILMLCCAHLPSAMPCAWPPHSPVCCPAAGTAYTTTTTTMPYDACSALYCACPLHRFGCRLLSC